MLPKNWPEKITESRYPMPRQGQGTRPKENEWASSPNSLLIENTGRVRLALNRRTGAAKKGMLFAPTAVLVIPAHGNSNKAGGKVVSNLAPVKAWVTHENYKSAHKNGG